MESLSIGKYRKTKAYGLVGCLSFMMFGSMLAISSIPGVGLETVHASVVNGGSDIKDADVSSPDNSGVAMTYTTYESGTSGKQTASGSGVFVAPNVMVTVAHNYLDKNKETNEGFVRGGDSAQSYVVTNSNTEKVNKNPQTGESQLVNKGDIHYYNDKELGYSYTNDLAVTILDKPIEAMTDGKDNARNIGTAEKGDDIRLVGYPNDFSSKNISDTNSERLKDGKLYEVRGTLSELNTTTGEGMYHMSALGGFSGGPIFNDKGDVVGIHQHGTNLDAIPENQQHGGGLFFTDKHKAWIKEMVDKYAIKGWYVDGDKKYYYDENHQSLKNVDKEIDGANYHFDEKGHAKLLSGIEKGQLVLKAFDKKGEKLFERVISKGNVGEAASYNFKSDKENQTFFSKNSNATVVSIDGETINKKFNESWSKFYESKYKLGDTVIKAVIDGASDFNRIVTGKVDTSYSGVKPLVVDDKVKAVPNGEKNFNATVSLTSEAGLGSGTLINDDTIVTVAHNFVHLNTKTNPISIVNNVNKSGDIYLATLPNGKQVRFSNDDVHFWNREGFVNGFKNDLAVIKLRHKFENEGGTKLHDTVQNVSSGDTVHVFGFPKGKLNPILNGKVETVENYGANIRGVAYQGSAPGMSGGGLYNAQGELIGVHQNGVEGLRSGGITFSKEQLDWINSIVRGENVQPVYLKDEHREDDKDKKPEKPVDKVSIEVIEPVVEYEGDTTKDRGYEKRIEGEKGSKTTITTYKWNNKTNSYEEKVLDPVIKPAGKTIVTVGTKAVTKTEVIPKGSRYEADKTLPFKYKKLAVTGHDGSIITTITYTVNPQTGVVSSNETKKGIDAKIDDVIKVGNTLFEDEFVPKESFYYASDKLDFGKIELEAEGRDGSRLVEYVYEVSPLDGTLSNPVIHRNEDEVGLMLSSSYVVGNKKVFKTDIPIVTRYVGVDTMDFGTNLNISDGKIGVHITTTTYTVNPKTGKLSNHVAIETDEPMIPKVVHIGTKSKVVTKVDDKGRKVTEKTTYTVDPNTGKVTSSTTTSYGDKAPTFEKKVVLSPKRYEKDSSREKGSENIVVKGKDGEDQIITTYVVDPKTGNVTPSVGKPVRTVNSTETVIKVAAKDKVEIKEIPSPKRYEADVNKDYGSQNDEIKGKVGSDVTTTVYTVNQSDGTVAEKSTTKHTDPTPTIVKIGTKPKVVTKVDDKGRKVIETTTYTVDSNTGKVTSSTTASYGDKASTVEKKVVPSPKRYEKDPTREKGSENIVVKGKDGEDQITTTYVVDLKTGNVTPSVVKPVRIINPTETLIKVAAKDKVETIRKNGDIIERTTRYTVNPDNGEISEETIDKLISSNGNGIKPPVVENNDFNGGVNGDLDGNSLLDEKPEYTGVIAGNGLDDNGNIIEPPVLKIPEFNGGVNGDLDEKPKFDSPKIKQPYLGTGWNDFGPKKDNSQFVSIIDEKLFDVDKEKPLDNFERNSTDFDKYSNKVSSNRFKSQLPNTSGNHNIAINILGALTLVSVLGVAVIKREKEED